ncbi:MAG TPA: hypothetical protein VF306_20105 [Pirellulales bacterium]
MRRSFGSRPVAQTVCVLAGCAISAWYIAGPATEVAKAGEQFAVIRPQLQFDAVDAWAVYPRGPSLNRDTRLLAGSRSRGRRFSRPPGSNPRSGDEVPATGNNRRRGRKPSPFEATGATPLLRDLPAAQRNPPPTRRRALGW